MKRRRKERKVKALVDFRREQVKTGNGRERS